MLPDRKNVEDAWTAQEVGESINRFLGTLDAQSRIIFVSRYWYAYSIREIAENLDISESHVKNTLFRTRKKLRARLQEEGIAV